MKYKNWYSDIRPTCLVQGIFMARSLFARYIAPYADIFFIIIILMLNTGLGSYYTHNGLSWYHQELMRTPALFPDYVFSLVWIFIFICTGAAAFLLSRLYRHTLIWQKIISLFIIAAMLNTAWSYLFFHKHMVFIALLDAILLQATILFTISLTWSSAREVAFLLLPYALWLCIALYLNYQVMILNPGL